MEVGSRFGVVFTTFRVASDRKSTCSGSRLSCWASSQSFPISPTSRFSDDRPKRAPGPAQLFRGTARSVWSELGVQLGRCYRGRLFIARIRCLHAACRMPGMPDAVHEYADASRFASWGSTRHCRSVEGRTDPVARNNNVPPNKHCCMQCAAGSWCMVLAILACLTVRVINSRNASEGTWDSRSDFSETEMASTGAADMSASRVEVGDGAPRGSEHDQCLALIRRLRAEIEGRDAENRRLAAENGVLLRERERDAERQRACGRARHPTGRRTSLLTFRL